MKRKLIIISGFSGSGKGTIIKELMKTNNSMWLSKSDTDRSKRNENDYYNYKTTEQMLLNINDRKYLEYNKYGNHYYATPKKEILDRLQNGYDVILEIDIKGMRMVCQDLDLKKMGTEIVTIFIACDAHLLEERLIGRGDSITEIQRRLKISVEESKSILGEYDFVVINNGTISDTVNKLECIIKSQIFEDNISFNDVSFREEIQEILQKYDM